MSCLQQDTWAAVALQIPLWSGILEHSQCFGSVCSKIQESSARRPLFAICFDKPVEEWISYLVFCTNVPFHTVIQVVSDICSSTCLKWNIFLSTQLHILLLFVSGMKLCTFKQHKLPFLQFLPCFISTKGKRPLVLVLLTSVQSCFIIKVIMIEEGIF